MCLALPSAARPACAAPKVSPAAAGRLPHLHLPHPSWSLPYSSGARTLRKANMPSLHLKLQHPQCPNTSYTDALSLLGLACISSSPLCSSHSELVQH